MVSDEEVSCKFVSEILLLFLLEDKEKCVTVFVNCWTKMNVENGRLISYIQFCNFFLPISLLSLCYNGTFFPVHHVTGNGQCNFYEPLPWTSAAVKLLHLWSTNPDVIQNFVSNNAAILIALLFLTYCSKNTLICQITRLTSFSKKKFSIGWIQELSHT